MLHFRVAILTIIVGLYSIVSSCQSIDIKPKYVYEIKQCDANSKHKKMLILLHGLGSNEQDLFSLASHIPSNYIVISARAPYVYGSGFAWYEISVESGKRKANNQQMSQSQKDIGIFVDQMSQLYDVAIPDVVLAGFSQGAIMSYGVSSAQLNIKSIGCFGGRISEPVEQQMRLKGDLSHLNTFVAHGTHDQMIDVSEARHAKDVLMTCKANLTYHEYPEGHTISSQMLGDFITWLQSIN
jgi:phospholipase/carboxylesterase